MRDRLFFGAAAAALAIASAAQSTTYQVTPATLSAFVSGTQPSLQCGDLVQLSGAFGALGFTNINPASCPTGSSITFDFGSATMPTLEFSNSSDLTILNGYPGPGTFTTFTLWSVQHVTVNKVHVLGGEPEMTIKWSNDVTVEWNSFFGSSGDDIDIVGSQYVQILDNLLGQTNANPVVHADGVQEWNDPASPYTSNNHITIHGNICAGHTQCFDNFGNVGPQSYITVTGNIAATDSQWLSDFSNVSNSVVSGNWGYEIVTAQDASVNYAGIWELSDQTGTGPSTDGNPTNTLSNNLASVLPNTSATLASPTYIASQIAALMNDAVAQDKAAKASPGTTAAKTAAAQATADLAAEQPFLTQLAALLATATTENTYGKSWGNYTSTLVTDANKQAGTPISMAPGAPPVISTTGPVAPTSLVAEVPGGSLTVVAPAQPATVIVPPDDNLLAH